MAEKTNTAPAAISFALPAKGCISGEIRFTMFSMAELNISEAITAPIQIRITDHSKKVIFRKNPKKTAKPAKTKWILKLCSVCIAFFIPE